MNHVNDNGLEPTIAILQKQMLVTCRKVVTNKIYSLMTTMGKNGLMMVNCGTEVRKNQQWQ